MERLASLYEPCLFNSSADTFIFSRYVAKYRIVAREPTIDCKLASVFLNQTQIPRELIAIIIWALKGNVKF